MKFLIAISAVIFSLFANNATAEYPDPSTYADSTDTTNTDSTATTPASPDSAAPAAPTNKPAANSYSTAVTKEDMNASMEQSVKDYNEMFQTDITKDQLRSTALAKIAETNAKLKDCVPGTYNSVTINEMYGHRQDNKTIVPFLTPNTTVIKGMSDNVCTVIMSPDTSEETTCQFPQSSLDFITSSHLGEGEFTAKPTFDKLVKILGEQCATKNSLAN